MKEFGYSVLINIDFDDFISPFTPKFLFRLRRYIKHSRQCFIDYPNTSNFGYFWIILVFGYPDETLSLVFDILVKILFSFVVLIVLYGRLLCMCYFEDTLYLHVFSAVV